MANLQYTIREMKHEDISQVLEIRSENGTYDVVSVIKTWLGIDPKGILVAVSDTGKVVGVCAMVIHSNKLAYAGLYCVAKRYQGLGIGFKLWSTCMVRIGSVNACLNGWPEKTPLYRGKGGYPVVETGWSIHHYATRQAVRADLLSDTTPSGVDIQPYDERDHLNATNAYDSELMGCSRREILRLSFAEEDSRSFVAMNSGRCVGFGSIKRCCDGSSRMGPWYADDSATAEALLKIAIESFAQGCGFTVKTTSDNEICQQLMEKVNCPLTGTAVRLYKKEPYLIDTKKAIGHMDIGFTPF